MQMWAESIHGVFTQIVGDGAISALQKSDVPFRGAVRFEFIQTMRANETGERCSPLPPFVGILWFV